MTAPVVANGLRKGKFRNRTHNKNQTTIVASTALSAGAGVAGISTTANEVALVQKIVFTGLTLDSATNETITIVVNGQALKFHFPGVADRRTTFRKEWNTNGNLVVNPSSTLTAGATTANNTSIEIHYQLMSLTDAVNHGYLLGGEMPTVASTASSYSLATELNGGAETAVVVSTAISTDLPATGTVNVHADNGVVTSVAYTSYTGSTFTIGSTDFSTNSASVGQAVWSSSITAGTERNLIPPVTGKCVEILGMCFTGHNFNAASDSAEISFMASGGTYGTDDNPITKVYCMGADRDYAPNYWIGDTQGCIQGPSGEGVYTNVTANLDGAAPTGEWVILYRYIPDSNLEVGDPTGKIGQIPGGSKFWVASQVPQNPSGHAIPWFGAYEFNYDAETANFQEGEDINMGGPVAVLQRLTDNGTDGTMRIGALISGAASAILDGNTITGNVSGGDADVDAPNGITTYTAPSCSVRILGHAVSMTSPSAVFASSTAIGVGVGSTLPVTAAHVGNDDASVGTAEVSSGFADDNLDVALSNTIVPGFVGTEVVAGDEPDRSVLAWGRLDGAQPTGSANVKRFT